MWHSLIRYIAGTFVIVHMQFTLLPRKLAVLPCQQVICYNCNDLRRWADNFCLHCNIFIYIRHIWIKPVLCSRMVSLFHHTSPWTHRCLQSSPNAHRNGRVFRCSVQTACCYWILNHGKSSSNCEIHRRMQAIYGDQCVDVSTVRRWVRWSVLMWVQ